MSAGVVQLLNTGQLPHDFWDWDTSAGFSWGGDDEDEGAEPEGAESGADTGTHIHLIKQLIGQRWRAESSRMRNRHCTRRYCAA